VDLERPNLAVAPDPEFGSFHSGPLMGSMESDAEGYLRLVANPFLSFCYLTAWLAVMYKTVAEGFAGPLTPMLLAMLVAALWLIPHLMHYHCLDCGGSGRLLRWKRHVCHAMVQRREAGFPRRFRGPTPPLQIVLWLWLLLAAALVVNALG